MSLILLTKFPPDDWTNLSVRSLGASDDLQCHPISSLIRDSLSPSDGMLIFNSDNNSFEGYWNSSWNSFGSTGGFGFTGPTGLQGIQGPFGDVGPQGPVGAQGAVGPTGLQGIQGSIGNVGPQGPVGPQGAVGPTGSVGPQGIIGVTGIQGGTGPTGLQGIQGVTGSLGPTGTVAITLPSTTNALLMFADTIGSVTSSLLESTVATLSTAQTFSAKTFDSASNNLLVNGVNINTYLNQALLTTASPTFATLGVGTAPNSSFITVADTTQNRKIVIWSGGLSNDHQYFGMGLNTNAYRFQVNNSGSDFVFYAGTSTTTSQEVFRVSGAGGIKLPTTGGTASILNYYENNTFTCNWTGAAVTSETVRFTMIGNQVTLVFGSLSATFASATTLLAATILPVRLRPITSPVYQYIQYLDNGGYSTSSGQVLVNISGSISIFTNGASGFFAGPGNVGHQAFVVTYLVI